MLKNATQSMLVRDQLVEVRSAAEIAVTLDHEGKTEGLPFMPEMAALCGRRFIVYRRAEKTCVEGHGLRALRNTVFLQDVYSDGGAHDGCQRKCRIFWKKAWLTPVASVPTTPAIGTDTALPEADLHRRL